MHHRGVRRRTEELGGESKVEGWGAEGRGADASTGNCLLNIGQYEALHQQEIVSFEERKITVPNFYARAPGKQRGLAQSRISRIFIFDKMETINECDSMLRNKFILKQSKVFPPRRK